MSVPGIYYHLGKFVVWIWHNHTQKKKIKYKEIVFKYPVRLFWTIGLVVGVLMIVCGYFLLKLIEM